MGLTQLQAAQRLGFNRTNTVSDWERGVSQVTPTEAALYLQRLQNPPVASSDDFSEGFAAAVSQMRALLDSLHAGRPAVPSATPDPPLPPASPAEVAAFQAMVDAGRASGSTEAAARAPRRTRK